MSFPRFTFFRRRDGGKVLSDDMAIVQPLVERYKAIALEQGWAMITGEELDQQIRSTVEAVRTELVLLEKSINGGFEVTPTQLHDRIRDLSDLRANCTASLPVGPDSETRRIPDAAWRFDWRRSSAIGLCAIACALMLAISVHSPSDSFCLVGCFAGLLILGPWSGGQRAKKFGSNVREVGNWIGCAIRARRIDRAIAQVERQLIEVGQRIAQADYWIQQHLDLVSNQMAIQRYRAQQAVKTIAAQNVGEREENGEFAIHYSQRRVR